MKLEGEKRNSRKKNSWRKGRYTEGRNKFLCLALKKSALITVMNVVWVQGWDVARVCSVHDFKKDCIWKHKFDFSLSLTRLSFWSRNWFFTYSSSYKYNERKQKLKNALWRSKKYRMNRRWGIKTLIRLLTEAHQRKWREGWGSSLDRRWGHVFSGRDAACSYVDKIKLVDVVEKEI